MKASAAIVAELRNGRSEVVRRAAEAPLAVRRCGDRVLLATTAATPVGGDEIVVDVSVGPGAQLAVGTVAATMVWPGPHGERSLSRTRALVDEGASLDLVPEPTVVVAGAVHRIETTIDLAATARCRIVEELALGRSGERAGDLELALRVTRGGRPLVHHSERFGPASPGGATSVSVGAGRYVVSAVVVGCPLGMTLSRADGATCSVAVGESLTVVEPSRAAAWLPVADDAAVLLAVGPDRSTTWATIASVLPPELAAATLLTGGMLPAVLPTAPIGTMVRPSDHQGTPC